LEDGYAPDLMEQETTKPIPTLVRVVNILNQKVKTKIKRRLVMSKAEKFIKDYTRGCSNELCAVEDRYGKKVISYHEWLTTEQAFAAVEIAREELIEKACEWLKSYRQDTPDGTGYIPGIVDDKMIEDFRNFLKGE
jgi:hypothetical protein